MNFNELLTFIAEDGESVTTQFERLVGSDNMPEFIMGSMPDFITFNS